MTASDGWTDKRMGCPHRMKLLQLIVLTLMLGQARGGTLTPLFLYTTLQPPSQNLTPSPVPPSNIPLSITTASITASTTSLGIATTSLDTTTTTTTTTLDFLTTSTERIRTPAPTEATTPQVDPDFNRCLPINTSSPVLTLNSTETTEGTVIRASCKAPYYVNSRIDDPTNSDVFSCLGGLWQPVTPRCLVDSTNSNTGIIVAIVIGTIIGLALVGGAVFLIFKMLKHRDILRQKQDELQTKMFRINDFVLSSDEDFIGMPVVSVQSRNSDLRGVPLDDFEEKFERSSSIPSVPPSNEDTLHLF